MKIDYEKLINDLIYKFQSNPDFVNLYYESRAVCFASRLFGQPVVSIYMSPASYYDEEQESYCDEDCYFDSTVEASTSDKNQKFTFYNVDKKKTLQKLQKEFEVHYNPHTGYYIEYTSFVYIGNKILFVYSKEMYDKLCSCIVTKEIVHEIGLAYISKDRILTKNIEIKDLFKSEEEFFANYNDDLPWDKITDFVHSDRSGIAILHGEPGTGKSSLIRHLAASNPDVKFCLMEQTLLSSVSNGAFIDWLYERKNSVLIVEDCEALLQSNGVRSNLLTNLLNISDGMLGDGLNIKFICTFNTGLRNIDPALLRKGRLKIKHEVKKLNANKVKAIFDKNKINAEAKDLPLSDIYNINIDNGNKDITKRVGF